MKIRITRIADKFEDTGWFDAAVKSPDAPEVLRPLLGGSVDSVVIDATHDEVAHEDGAGRKYTRSSALKAITDWAESLPGWEARQHSDSGTAHRPLVFEVLF